MSLKSDQLSSLKSKRNENQILFWSNKFDHFHLGSENHLKSFITWNGFWNSEKGGILVLTQRIQS